MSRLFYALTGRDFKRSIDSQRIPGELPSQDTIREGDEFYTPITARIDDSQWRPVLPHMVGTLVGPRRIRRNK